MMKHSGFLVSLTDNNLLSDVYVLGAREKRTFTVNDNCPSHNVILPLSMNKEKRPIMLCLTRKKLNKETHCVAKERKESLVVRAQEMLIHISGSGRAFLCDLERLVYCLTLKWQQYPKQERYGCWNEKKTF